MRVPVSRREFLKSGLAGGAGAMVVWPGKGTAVPAADLPQGICVTLANHWSYIGIGWQLGIESCVLSATDAMELADRPPHVKTLLNLDARAYEFMAEKFPEVTERLKGYLASGKVELIGGTYGQPMGTTVGGESNIRQVVHGRETIRKALGYEMVSFLEEEEFTHPQLPQILIGAGFRYASLAQVDTWGNAGIPRIELNAMHWKGKDGTTILSVPKNSLFGYSPDLKKLVSTPEFQKLQALGKPLIFTWEEFGWEPHDEPAYLKTPEKYLKFSQQSPVEYVTLKEYLDKYGASAKETRFLDMDAWNKLLTWGLGGDQLRIMDRKVEALLLAAERFDAIAQSLGASSQEAALDKAWKNLLASQSHDVGLCEYSRWQADRMPPVDRIEDKHNFTWGVMGYKHLDAAQVAGESVLSSSLAHISKRVSSPAAKQGQHSVTVFNPHAWERTDIATTGRIYPLPAKVKGVVVKDAKGREVPAQIMKSEQDHDGNLIVADVAFLAEKVPSVGYDTYHLEFTPSVALSPETDLRVDEGQLRMENQFLKVALSPNHGAIISLMDKATGRELLDGEKGPFPIFRGTPNRKFPLRAAFLKWKYPEQELPIPELFDSSTARLASAAPVAPTTAVDWRVASKSDMKFTEKGPLRATVRTRHSWPLLKFETYVTLQAHLPCVEVFSRVLVEIPPAPDALDSDGRFPVEIKNGYWFTFTPGFKPTQVIRDYPLGVEPTQHHHLHALTFLDLVGEQDAMLVLHSGTQYFRRDSDGAFSNLVMREWESYFTGEYGWPRMSEYRHALMPHAAGFTNAARLRAAAEFSQKLVTVVGESHTGSLAARKSFLSVTPENVRLSAFRGSERGFELRVIEVEGREAEASVDLALPVTQAEEVNLLGSKIGEVGYRGGKLSFKMQPWKIKTLGLK